MKRSAFPVRLVRPRSGKGISILDACLRTLSDERDQARWPARSFRELTDNVSSLVKYKVKIETVQSVVYKHRDLFERNLEGTAVRWSLSNKVKAMYR